MRGGDSIIMSSFAPEARESSLELERSLERDDRPRLSRLSLFGWMMWSKDRRRSEDSWLPSGCKCNEFLLEEAISLTDEVEEEFE